MQSVLVVEMHSESTFFRQALRLQSGGSVPDAGFTERGSQMFENHSLQNARVPVALFSCLLALSFACTAGAQHVQMAKAPVSLEYYDSSIGLDTPRMEEGRTEIELGDVNGDGFVDIVSIGDHGSPYVNSQEHGIMVWLGDGGDTWTVLQSGAFGYGGIALGDVNNDGLMDAGYGMHHNWGSGDFGDQLIEVALGNGSGANWFPWDDGLAQNGEDWGMFCTDFADVDNDGDLDIAANSFGGGSGVHVYLNNMDGTWTQSFGFTGGNSTDDIVFGEVNNDGNPDFAVAHEYGTVYLGNGSGGFTKADGNLPGGGWAGRSCPDLGDVDGDACDDLSWVTGSGGIEVWRWAGSGAWDDFSGDLPGSGPYQSTQLCDMDMDGCVDVVAYGGNRVTVWRGDGAGGWVIAANFTVASEGDFSAFRVGPDVDRNGKPDIALVNEENGWLHNVNHPYIFREASIPSALKVKATHPRGGEILAAGSVCFFDWVSAVPGGVSSNITMEISLAGLEGPWTMVAADLPDNGRRQAVIPSGISSGDCRLRLTLSAGAESATQVTGSSFTIR